MAAILDSVYHGVPSISQGLTSSQVVFSGPGYRGAVFCGPPWGESTAPKRVSRQQKEEASLPAPAL